MSPFLDCERVLSNADLKSVNEAFFEGKLPNEMLRHYARFNVGCPERDWFPASDEWDAIWVQCFYPIKFSGDSSSSLEAHYSQMVAKGVIPKMLVPFAVDPGGDFFCIDLTSHRVSYFTTDTRDSNATPEENHRNANRVIAESFDQFIAQLTTEDEAYG